MQLSHHIAMDPVILKTFPDKIVEDDIFIPRDMDLPWSVQLYKPEDGVPCNCDNIDELDPYNTAGHQFIMEIFKSSNSLEPLVEFGDEMWTRAASAGQEAPVVDDIVRRIIKWEDHSPILQLGVPYWYRFRSLDAIETKFGIVVGKFLKGLQ